MNEVIGEPRTKISEFAPRFYTLQIPTDKIRDLIGPGGKVIRGIIEADGRQDRRGRQRQGQRFVERPGGSGQRRCR